MVAHPDVGVDRNFVFAGDVEQQVVVVLAVDIIDKYRAVVDAALRDVEREPGKVESRLTWHGGRVARPADEGNRMSTTSA